MIRRRLVYNKVDTAPLDWKFYLALAVGALLTILFYYFVVGFKELYRHANVHEYNGFISLSPLRYYLYNLFFAFISTIVGFMVFTKMWVPSNLAMPPLLRGRILFDQQYVPGMFIYLFLKLGMLFCFVIYGNVVFRYLDMGSEFWPLFVVAPVFLFLHQWMTLRLRVKQATMRLMLLTGTGQVLFAAILAAIPFHDFSKLDELAMRRTPTEMLKLEVPTSRLRGVSSKHWMAKDMHIGFRKDNGDLVMSFDSFKSDFISIDTLLSRFWKAEEDIYSSVYPSKPTLTINLYADREVPAFRIIEIIKRLKLNGTIHYRFISNDAYDAFGLPMLAVGYCREISDRLKLEYSRVIEWSSDTVTFFYPKPCPESNNYKNFEVFTVAFKDGRIFLEGEAMSRQQIYDWAYERIAQQHDNGGKETIIVPIVDDSTSYETFLTAYGETYNALVDIRTQRLKEHSGTEYQPDAIFQKDEMELDDIAYVKEFKEMFWQIIGPEEEDLYRELFGDLNRFKTH